LQNNNNGMQNFDFSGQFNNIGGNNFISVKLPVYLFQEDNVFIAYCPSLDLSGSGNSMEESKKSFEESLNIYLNYCITKNTLIKDLRNHGWNVRGHKQHKIKAPGFDELLSNNEELKDILENKEYQKFDAPIEIPVS
jgi:hypothetical protein